MYIAGAGTRGRLVDCDLAVNGEAGVAIVEYADPFLKDCS